MSTTLRSGRFTSRSFRSTSKKSVLMSRSCTSSITTCETPPSDGSLTIRRSSTPVVTNSMHPDFRGETPLRRTLYPTELPSFSPRSSATRSATEEAAMRLGCVTTMFVETPSPRAIASSRMYWGHWVDFPLPVPPETTTTWFVFKASSRSSRIALIGRASRIIFMILCGPSGSDRASSRRPLSSASITLFNCSFLLRIWSDSPSNVFERFSFIVCLKEACVLELCFSSKVVCTLSSSAMRSS
mmetsp:Transcript_6217/g.13024  ORF Transcript_6217/g.13024 Transcript_6217/m.13024 type:complete len:242 (+) Transcript_6217:2349-3074(+)